MINNTTNISLSNYIREAIEGCDFSHKAEMDIITLVHKRDMTYDFYLKHIMSAFEWKNNQLINKDKNLIINFHVIGDILLIINLTVIGIKLFKRIYITGNKLSPYSVATGSENYYLLAPKFSFIKKIYLHEYI